MVLGNMTQEGNLKRGFITKCNKYQGFFTEQCYTGLYSTLFPNIAVPILIWVEPSKMALL